MRLRDDQWQKLEPLLIGRPGHPGANGRNNRQFIDAMILIASNKVRWTCLPPELGSQGATYMRFRRWTESGRWDQLAEAVSDDQDLFGTMQRIAAQGHSCTARIQQRLRGQANETMYRARLDEAPLAAAETTRPTELASNTDNSTLHWAGLVSDRTPCILPDLKRQSIMQEN
jgi:transposase